MALPGRFEFLGPLLQVLGKHPAGLARDEAVALVAKAMRIKPADAAQTYANGRSKLAYHLGYNCSILAGKGMVERVKTSGDWRITAAGKKTLAAHPQGIPIDLAKTWCRAKK